MKTKTVYVGLAVDIFHEGYINLLRFVSKYGHVVVGLLTDKAIAAYKKFPHLNFRQRYSVIKYIRYVYKVVSKANLKDDFKKLDINLNRHIDKILDGINLLRVKNNPIQIKQKDIKKILKST